MLNSLLRAVVDKYDLQKVRETNNGILCLCPMHDNTDSAALSMSEKGLWMCFAEQTVGNLAHFISKVDGIPLHKAYIKAEELGFDKPDSEITARKFVDPAEAKLEQQAALTEHFDFLQRSYRNFTHPYLINRGLKKSTVDLFRCGYDPENLRISLPVFSNDGVLHGFQYRRVDMKDYISEPGFEKSHWLFGEQFINGFSGWPLLIESAVDVMWLRQEGITAFATMGKFSRTQADRICRLGYEKVIVGFDNDEPDSLGMQAGEVMTERACEFFSGRAAVYRFDYSNFKSKDWFGVKRAQILEMYRNAFLIKA